VHLSILLGGSPPTRISRLEVAPTEGWELGGGGEGVVAGAGALAGPADPRAARSDPSRCEI